MNLRGAKAELDEAGEDTEGMANSTAELRAELLKLTGVDIMLDENTFKSTFQILQEMSQVWDKMTDIDQAAALELMGGKRQANSLAAIIDNFDTAVAARDAALDSSGSAWQENEAYLDSINGKLGQFQASFQGLTTSVLDSGLVKWFLDLASAVTQSAETITNVTGGPGWLLGGALGAFASYQDAGLLSVIDNPDTFSGKELTLFSNISTGIKDVEKTQIEGYNKLLKDLVSGSENAQRNMESFKKTIANTRMSEYIQGLNGAEASLSGFSKSLGNVSIASKAAALGMQALSTAGNMLIGMAIGAAINGIINGLVYLAETEDRVAENAQEANSAYQDNASSLSQYESRVSELQSSLASGTLSLEESKTARSELLQIQEEMIDKFGSEAGAADLVTQAINGQTDAWDKLSKIQIEDWYLGASKKDLFGTNAIDESINNMEKSISTSWNTAYAQVPYQLYDKVAKAQKDFLDDYSDIFSFSEQISASGERYIDKIKVSSVVDWNEVDVSELRDSYASYIRNALTGSATEEEISKIVSDVTDEFNGVLSEINASSTEITNEWGEAYSNLGLYKILENEEYSELLEKFTEAQSEYEEALTSGDDTATDSAAKTLKEAFANVQDTISNDNTPKVVSEYFKDIMSEIDSLISEWDFGDKLEETLGESFDKLGSINESDLYAAIMGDGSKELSKLWDNITGIAVEEGIIPENFGVEDIETLINLLVELGFVTSSSSDSISSLSDKFTQLSDSIAATKEEASLVSEIINTQSTGVGITLENFESLIAANEDYADALEYNNGVMQLNADKLREIANEDISDQIRKASMELKIQGNALVETESSLAEYKTQLRNLQNQQKNGIEVDEIKLSYLEKMVDEYEQSSQSIQLNIDKYSVLISSLREATGAYQAWQNAQNAAESGDMYDDTYTALQDIQEGLETGKIGTKSFQAAVEFLVPDSIDKENISAIEEYKNNFLDRYITFDEENQKIVVDGVSNFMNDAVDQGLATFDEDGNWNINSGVIMQDFADKLQLTPEMVRAIFGELEEYGGDFSWDDELAESLSLSEEEIKEYKDQINQTIAEIGNDPIDIKANVTELTQAEADLYDLENYDLPGIIELPVNVKASLQIQSDIDEKQKYIEELEEELKIYEASNDEESALKITANISEAEREITELQIKLSSLEKPTQVEIDLATSVIDQQIADLKVELSSLQVGTPEYDEVNSQIESLNNTKVQITTLLDKTEFDSNTEDVSAKMDDLDAKEANPTVSLEGYYTTIRQINNIASAISGIPSSKIVTVKYNQTGTSQYKPPASSLGPTGTHGLNGTAHAFGNWGLASSQRSLVGELGRELVVNPYTGKWYTVGNYGAEMVDLPKGAIIFNHEQTEDILKKGYVHGRGTSFVTGNAYVTGGISTLPIQVGKGEATWSGNSPTADSLKDTADAAEKATDAVEEYVSELWELYEVETKLADIQADTSIFDTQLDMAESANERIGIREKLIDQYKAEQDALHDLAEARRELIKQDIAELQSKGFIIEYDPEYNNLLIKNTEHINDLIGATTEETNELRQETEEMINTIIDMNDANQEAGDSWWQLAQNIQDAKNEIANDAISIFDDFIEYMDAFELWGDSAEDRIEVLNKKQAELNRLWELGYLTLDQYKDLTMDNQTEIYEQQRDAIVEIIELTEEMIKQEVEDQIDALEKQIDAYREIIELRKEALEQGKEEDHHQDELAEKLKELAKLRQQIDRLGLAADQGDRNAAAQKIALEEQYAQLQKEIVDMQSDYTYDQQQETLDKELESFEDQKNEEIDILEESIDTQVKLYNLAIARINEGWDKLYDDLIAWNREYGDGISGDDSIKTAWEIATEAVKDYAYNVEAALEGIKTEGSIGNLTGDRATDIVNQMRLNGRKWNEATSPEEKAQYEAANERLAQQLSAVIGRPVVKGYDGYWYLDKVGGTKLYDIYPGSLDADKVNSLVDQMHENGSLWNQATTQAQKNQYERANEQLAQQISALIGRNVIKGYDGEWYLDEVGGTRLYDVWKGSSSMPTPPTEDEAEQNNQTEVKVRALVRDMKSNGTKYANAISDDEREYYAARNRELAQQISQLLGRKVVIGNDGVWYLDRVGGRKLYDIYHQGGIVGGMGTLSDNEVFSVLEKGELVLNDSQKKRLASIIDVVKDLMATPSNKLVPSKSSIENNLSGVDNFQANFDIDFNLDGSFDESSVRKYGDMFADYAIRKLQSGFSKSGITPNRIALGKA